MKATKPQVKLANNQKKLLSYRAKNEEKSTHCCIAINSVTIVFPQKMRCRNPLHPPRHGFDDPTSFTHPSPLAKRVESGQRLYLANIGRARAHILQDVCVRASFMGLEKLELLEVYLATT